MNTTTDMTAANTILAQLGGPRFIAMTGAKHLFGDADTLKFRIGTGAKDKINAVEITLCPTDTYTIRFYRVGRAPSFGCTLVKEVENVYVDSLQAVFTAATGFRTSL